MAVCVEQRVDNHDLTITSTEVQQVGQILNDTARNKLLILFTQCLSGTTKQTACFREFDLVTQTFGSVVQIEADTNIQSKYYLHAALLLDGTIVVAYSLGGPGTGWRVRESTDHGLNWTTTLDFETGGVEEAVGLAARDNTLWMFSLNGSSAQDLYKRTRVSGNNWNAKELIFNGSAGESWAFSQNAAQMAVLFADGTACVVGGRITGFSQTAVKALYYNGFSWIESLIQSYGDTQDREPIVIEGASSRLWVMFIHRISLKPKGSPRLSEEKSAPTPVLPVPSPPPIQEEADTQITEPPEKVETPQPKDSKKNRGGKIPGKSGPRKKNGRDKQNGEQN